MLLFITYSKESFKSELATFLSEDQLTKMKELHEAKNTDKPEKTPEQRAEAQTKKMTEELNLTEDQQKQVMELNLKVEHKIQAIKNDDSMSDEKKKKFIAGNKKDKRNALSAILTADQMEILNAKKDKKKSEKK